MPDEYADDHDESNVIKDLRIKAKRADDLDAEVKALRQETAILKAGITDLTPAKQKALLAAHEGDLDAESLRKTATELGFIAVLAAEAETPQVSAEEQAAHQRVAEATAAAEPSEAQLKTLEDKMREARSPEELAAILDNAGLLLQDD